MPNRSEIDKATEKVRQFIHDVAVEDGMPESVQTTLVTWDRPTAKQLHLDAAVIDAIGLRVAEVSFWVPNEDGKGGSGCTYMQGDVPHGLAVCAQTERAIIAVSSAHIFDADEELALLKLLLVPEPKVDVDLTDLSLAIGTTGTLVAKAEALANLRGLNPNDPTTWDALMNEVAEDLSDPPITVHFQPEAWINDYATTVDDQGPDTWVVGQETAEQIQQTDVENQDLDFVRGDAFAPHWVANWSGPFTIEIVTKEDS